MQPYYDPEAISLLASALDGAIAMLPAKSRTDAIRVLLASHILVLAARGERNSGCLQRRALMWIDASMLQTG